MLDLKYIVIQVFNLFLGGIRKEWVMCLLLKIKTNVEDVGKFKQHSYFKELFLQILDIPWNLWMLLF